MTIENYRFKLFLEGVEVPNAAWQASITCQANAHARCTLSVVPIPTARNVLPRTLVHLFWHDDEDWRAIFCGEVTGRGIEESHTSRNVVYHCKGFSSYWDHSYRAYYDQKASMPTIAAEHLNISVQGTSSDPKTVTINTFLNTAFAQIKGDTKPIDQGIKAILNRMVNINAFFELAHNRLDLIRRNYVVNNEFSGTLLSNFVGTGSFSVDTQMGPLATLSDLFQVLFPMVYLQFVPLTSPAMVSSRSDTLHDGAAADIPVDMLFLPEVNFAPPPWCNVIYPDQYVQFNYHEDFMAAPTRSFIFAGHKVDNKIQYLTYIAPYEDFYGERFDLTAAEKELLESLNSDQEKDIKQLQEIARTKRLTEEQQKALSAYVDVDDFNNPKGSHVLFHEELLKGAVFSQQFIRGRDTIYAIPDETVPGKLLSDPATIVNYMHFNNRAASRSMPTVSMRFNPYLVAGLPALLLYRYGPFLGTVGAYTHSISGKGQARTSCQLHHVRMVELDEEENENEMNGPPPYFYADDNRELKHGQPLWYDDDLNAQNIGKTFYEKALGVDSIMSVQADGKQGMATTLHEAVKRVHAAYFSLSADKNRDEYIRQQTWRRIPTVEEVFAALGTSDLSNLSNSILTVPPNKERTLDIKNKKSIDDLIAKAIGRPFISERHTWATNLAKEYQRRVVNEEGRGARID